MSNLKAKITRLVSNAFLDHRCKGRAVIISPTAHPLHGIAKADCQRQSVTPVRGPRSMIISSGKVAGKVLIVDHM